MQGAKSNEQRAKSNEQKVTSNEQKVTSNKQKVTSKEQKLTSNELKVQPHMKPRKLVYSSFLDESLIYSRICCKRFDIKVPEKNNH